VTTTLLAPSGIRFPDHCQFSWCLGEGCNESPDSPDLRLHSGRPSSVRGFEDLIVSVRPLAFTEPDETYYGVPMVVIGIETDTCDAQIDLSVREALALSLAITSFGNGEVPVGEHSVFEGVAAGQPSGATLTVTRLDDLTIGKATYNIVELAIANEDSNPTHGTIQIGGHDAQEFARYVVATAAEVSA
jgi:hypothetical protein